MVSSISAVLLAVVISWELIVKLVINSAERRNRAKMGVQIFIIITAVNIRSQALNLELLQAIRARWIVIMMLCSARHMSVLW